MTSIDSEYEIDNYNSTFRKKVDKGAKNRKKDWDCTKLDSDCKCLASCLIYASYTFISSNFGGF